MSNPKVIEAITAQVARGAGTEVDPVRWVTQVFTKDGNLIAESDPVHDVVIRNFQKLRDHNESLASGIEDLRLNHTILMAETFNP